MLRHTHTHTRAHSNSCFSPTLLALRQANSGCLTASSTNADERAARQPPSARARAEQTNWHCMNESTDQRTNQPTSQALKQQLAEQPTGRPTIRLTQRRLFSIIFFSYAIGSVSLLACSLLLLLSCQFGACVRACALLLLLLLNFLYAVVGLAKCASCGQFHLYLERRTGKKDSRAAWHTGDRAS